MGHLIRLILITSIILGLASLARASGFVLDTGYPAGGEYTGVSGDAAYSTLTDGSYGGGALVRFQNLALVKARLHTIGIGRVQDQLQNSLF